MTPRPALTSQHGEDFLILSAFGWQQRGFYVDVGAFDGVYGSNTWALAQLGWRGICIEPSPQIFPLLTKNRPSALCVEGASGAEPGIAKLSMDPTLQFRSLESMDRVRESFDKAHELSGLTSSAFSSVDIDIVTLNSVLRRTPGWDTIDLLFIDARSADHDILAGLDPVWRRPRLIVISIDDDARLQMAIDQLEEMGYSLCRTLHRSMFFTAERGLARRLRKTEINCFLPRNLHPFGLAHTRLPQRNDRVLLHGHEHILEELATRIDENPSMNDRASVQDGA